MEDLFGVLCAALIFLLSVASKSRKNKKKNTVQMHSAIPSEPQDKPQEIELRAAAPKAATPKAAAKIVNDLQAAHVKQTPAALDHMHEGKAEAPCPAEEIRPSLRADEKPAAPAVPGLKLSFDRNSVVQGFVMSEILNRPRPGMRR